MITRDADDPLSTTPSPAGTGHPAPTGRTSAPSAPAPVVLRMVPAATEPAGRVEELNLIRRAGGVYDPLGDVWWTAWRPDGSAQPLNLLFEAVREHGTYVLAEVIAPEGPERVTG